MEQEEKTSFFNHALRWAIINGAIGIFIFVILYVVDYALMVNWKMGIVGLVIGLSVVSYATVDYRKSIGGFLSYGKAWQYGFVVFAIAGLISVIFNMLLYNVIDSELPQKLTDVALENQRGMMENFGAQPDQIDKAIEEARARTENQFKIGGMAIGYGIQLVIYTILSLVTAIFGRRNPPMDQM
jgi:hypothetical protein